MIAVLLYRGSGFIGRAIRWQTRSPYSHAAIVVNQWVYEAREFKGVIKRPLRESDLDEAVWFNVKPFPSEKFSALVQWMESQVGKKYDYLMVLRFISRRQETRESTGKWFCSEFVFAALQKIGVLLFNHTEPYEVSPGLLPRSLRLELDAESQWRPAPDPVFTKWETTPAQGV